MFEEFKKGDYVLIHSTEGEGVGNFEVNQILNTNSHKMEVKYPLTNSFKDDLRNHSQVILIHQYSRVTIEKDSQLFHKAQKEGIGGVIAFMASEGFTIKGYIVDASRDTPEVESIPKLRFKKSKSGVVFGLANFNEGIARKVFDLKFTSRYPTITLPPNKQLKVLNNGGAVFEAAEYQHVTIPPDLNLHLTAEGVTKTYEFFKPKKPLLTLSGGLSRRYVKLLSLTYPAIQDCPIFTNKQYSACFMIAFAQMPHWTKNSHFTLELFAIKNENVRIPVGSHKKGELGVLQPFQVYYKDEKSAKTIQYCIQPFVVISHDKEESLQIRFW